MADTTWLQTDGGGKRISADHRGRHRGRFGRPAEAVRRLLIRQLSRTRAKISWETVRRPRSSRADGGPQVLLASLLMLAIGTIGDCGSAASSRSCATASAPR